MRWRSLRRRRSRISKQDLHYVIVFAIIATIVASSLTYVTLNPPPEEQFFASWVLGAQGMAADYYPNNNPNINPGIQVTWTLGVYNHMGSLQYVVLRVKLLNSTMEAPNDTTGQPSQAPTVLEFARVLVNNETWSIPFVWEIQNATAIQGTVTITGLSINQTTLAGQFASAYSGQNFRFVFELWHYDATTNQLSFTWTTSDGQLHAAWTQIWFSTTPSATPSGQ
jgi:uncharacterized membrane protein